MSSSVVPADRRSKIFLTVACYYSFFVVSTIESVAFTAGPMHASDSGSSQNYAYAMSTKAIVLTIGCILNGVLFEKVNKRIGIIVALLLVPAPVVSIILGINGPWLLLSSGVLGFFLSMFEVCVVSLVLDIWSGAKKSPSFLLGLYTFWHIGSLLAVLTANFVFNQDSPSRRTNSFTKFILVVGTLVVPAFFGAIFHALLLLVQLRSSKSINKALTAQPVSSSFAYHARGPHSAQNVFSLTNIPRPLDAPNVQEPQLQKQPDPESQITWKSFFISGLILFLFAGVFHVVNFNVFFLSKWMNIQTVALSQSIMNVSDLAAKLVALVACIYISTSKISLSALSFAFAGLPLIFFLAKSSTTFMCIGYGLFGCTNSVFPTLICSIMDQRKHLNNLAVGLFIFASHAGFIASSTIVAWAMPEKLVAHSAFAFASLSTCLVLFMLFLKKIR